MKTTYILILAALAVFVADGCRKKQASRRNTGGGEVRLIMVKYEAWGTAHTVNITYTSNDSDTTRIASATLPWYEIKFMEEGGLAGIKAEILGGEGEAHVRIFMRVVIEADTTDFTGARDAYQHASDSLAHDRSLTAQTRAAALIPFDSTFNEALDKLQRGMHLAGEQSTYGSGEPAEMTAPVE